MDTPEVASPEGPLAPGDALDMIARADLGAEGLMRVAALAMDQAWLYRRDPKLAELTERRLVMAWAALSVLVLGIEPEPKPPAEMDHDVARIIAFPPSVRLRAAA